MRWAPARRTVAGSIPVSVGNSLLPTGRVMPHSRTSFPDDLHQLAQARLGAVPLAELLAYRTHDLGIVPRAAQHVRYLVLRPILRQHQLFGGRIPEDRPHIVAVEH